MNVFNGVKYASGVCIGFVAHIVVYRIAVVEYTAATQKFVVDSNIRFVCKQTF